MGNAPCCRLEAEPQAPTQCEPAVPVPQKVTYGLQKPAPPPPIIRVTGFVVEVHSATLSRSFAKVGTMNPFAVVRMRINNADQALEILRTSPAQGSHMTPRWTAQNIKQMEDIPDDILVDVWDKNRFHKDVFCGSATIPCSSEMGCLDQQNFTLEKRSRSTGSVCLSLKVLLSADSSGQRQKRTMTETTIGAEFDEVFASVAGGASAGERKPTLLSLKRDEMPDEDDVDADDTDGAVDAFQTCVSVPRLPSKPSSAFPANDIVGSWTCTATQGLDEFLVASGAGIFQRKLAKAAKWPAWDFTADGDNLVFVNHSAIGDITETMPFNVEYDFTDGKKNAWKCKATWTPTDFGGTLFIARHGKEGEYSEERKVSGDKMEFILNNSQVGCSWGRTFVRDC